MSSGSVILLLLTLAGCAGTGGQLDIRALNDAAHTNGWKGSPFFSMGNHADNALPPMPEAMYSPPQAPSPMTPQVLAVQPLSVSRNVSLSYELQPVDGYTQQLLETGISATTDFSNWTVVWFEPYPTAQVVNVTLSNRVAGAEFYRAFWRYKQ